MLRLRASGRASSHCQALLRRWPAGRRSTGFKPTATRARYGAIRQDLVYALAFDARSRLIAATGNRGYLYRIDSDYSFTRLVNLTSTQVTGLCSAPDGTLYAVTGNIGKLFSVGPRTEASGVYESDVLDANAFYLLGPDYGRSGLATRRGL